MAPSELRPSSGALNPALPTALARRPSGIVLASALVNVHRRLRRRALSVLEKLDAAAFASLAESLLSLMSREYSRADDISDNETGEWGVYARRRERKWALRVGDKAAAVLRQLAGSDRVRPVPVPSRVAVLACRHSRLGQSCPPSLQKQRQLDGHLLVPVRQPRQQRLDVR